MLLRRWVVCLLIGGVGLYIIVLKLKPLQSHDVQSLADDSPVLHFRSAIDSVEASPAKSQAPISTDNNADLVLSRLRAVQKERQERLREACLSVPIRTHVLGTMLNVNDLGITYCCIAKCASTTFKTFAEMITDNTCPDLDPHYCAREKFPAVRSIKQFLSHSLIIVRNPWDRLVSSYIDKFVQERIRFSKNCYDYHNKTLYGGPPVSFAEFVECLLHDVALGRPLNPHIAPLHWHCMPCQANYTYIATLETLNMDFKYLKAVIFPDTYPQQAYDRAFASLHRRRHEKQNSTALTYKRAYSSLSKKALSSLIKIYASDAIMFGYNVDPLTKYASAKTSNGRTPHGLLNKS